MRKMRVLMTILKSTNLDKILYGFIMFVLLASCIFILVEPNITNYEERIMV